MMDSPAHLDHALVDTISRDLPRLSKTFRRIGDYLVAEPADFMHKSLQEISKATNVSEPSVVRFCRHFGFKGIPDFRIALAISLADKTTAANRSFLEPRISDKAVVNLRLKQAIAQFAMTLLETDRSIILDSGSTTQLFAQHLRGASGRIIMTTGLNIIDSLCAATQHTLMLPGGTLRFESMSLSGRLVESTLANMRFDTAYLGADAIDPDSGLSTFNEDEAHQNAAMVSASQRVVVLADSSKFRAPGLHRFCEIDRIDTIVTDIGLSDEIASLITARGVTVHRVDPGAEGA